MTEANIDFVNRVGGLALAFAGAWAAHRWLGWEFDRVLLGFVIFAVAGSRGHSSTVRN